jgi:hypothetical protein
MSASEVQPDMSAGRTSNRQADCGRMRVAFLIDGELSGTVLAGFPEFDAARGPAGGTALFGSVADRTHLDRVLSRFRDLGIAVVEFRQLPD